MTFKEIRGAGVDAYKILMSCSDLVTIDKDDHFVTICAVYVDSPALIGAVEILISNDIAFTANNNRLKYSLPNESVQARYFD